MLLAPRLTAFAWRSLADLGCQETARRLTRPWIRQAVDGTVEPVVQKPGGETQRHEGLKQALGRLDARSRRIIEARWLREDDQATLQQLADEYGVSAERIRQIESKAIRQMRGAMAEVA